MRFYDVIVDLLNIHEIKYQITDQAISGTCHDNLVRFWQSIPIINVYFSFIKSKPLDMTFKVTIRQNFKHENYKYTVIFC